jgi:hypothetical protein
MTESGDSDSPPRPWWRGPIVWSLVLSAAIAAYELTAQPALAVITVGLKCGWGRFTTGFWLLRRDPIRPRGRAGFFLFVGYGFWLAALIGFGLFLVIPNVLPKPVVFGPGNKPGDPVAEAFLGAGITWFAGMALASVAFATAVVIAYRNGFRLWLHPDVSLARERGQWPPTYGRENKAHFPIIVSIFLLVEVLGTVAAVALAAGIDALGGVIPKQTALWILSGLCLLVLPLAALRLIDGIRRRVLAREPWEFWTDPPPPED